MSYLEGNLAASDVALSDADVEAIAAALPAAAGTRYPESIMSQVDI